MAAVFGLQQSNTWRHVARLRQRFGGNEGVVECIQNQGRHGDLVQQGFGAGAAVVVGGIGKAVHGGGEAVVEIGEVGGGLHGSGVNLRETGGASGGFG